MLPDDDFNSAFIDTDEFAIEANPDWSTSNINGVFFKAGLTVQTEGGGIETTDPVFMIRDTDAAGADQNDVIVIPASGTGSTTYYIIKIMPDGLGMTYLTLSENAAL